MPTGCMELCLATDELDAQVQKSTKGFLPMHTKTHTHPPTHPHTHTHHTMLLVFRSGQYLSPLVGLPSQLVPRCTTGMTCHTCYSCSTHSPLMHFAPIQHGSRQKEHRAGQGRAVHLHVLFIAYTRALAALCHAEHFEQPQRIIQVSIPWSG